MPTDANRSDPGAETTAVLTLAATIDPKAFASPMTNRAARDRSIAVHCAATYVSTLGSAGFSIVRTVPDGSTLRADLAAAITRAERAEALLVLRDRNAPALATEHAMRLQAEAERDAARAELAGARPFGWKLVPPWSNKIMREAMRAAVPVVPGDILDEALRAALAASPSPSQDHATVDEEGRQ